jgi:hypothetical protein
MLFYLHFIITKSHSIVEHLLLYLKTTQRIAKILIAKAPCLFDDLMGKKRRNRESKKKEKQNK